ncbi:MAG: hypothetical protein AAB552_01935 [Patescibacteria group bacterium]
MMEKIKEVLSGLLISFSDNQAFLWSMVVAMIMLAIYMTRGKSWVKSQRKKISGNEKIRYRDGDMCPTCGELSICVVPAVHDKDARFFLGLSGDVGSHEPNQTMAAWDPDGVFGDSCVAKCTNPLCSYAKDFVK